MGLVTLDPASDYMRLIAPVLKSRLTLASDAWMQWLPTKTVHQRIRSLSAFLYNAMADSSISASDLTRLLADTVLSGSVATLLQPAYAARFKGMSETDIDDVLQSFALSKCRPNQALVDTLKKHLARPA